MCENHITRTILLLSEASICPSKDVIIFLTKNLTCIGLLDLDMV